MPLISSDMSQEVGDDSWQYAGAARVAHHDEAYVLSVLETSLLRQEAGSFRPFRPRVVSPLSNDDAPCRHD